MTISYVLTYDDIVRRQLTVTVVHAAAQAQRPVRRPGRGSAVRLGGVGAQAAGPGAEPRTGGPGVTGLGGLACGHCLARPGPQPEAPGPVTVAALSLPAGGGPVTVTVTVAGPA